MPTFGPSHFSVRVSLFTPRCQSRGHLQQSEPGYLRLRVAMSNCRTHGMGTSGPTRRLDDDRPRRLTERRWSALRARRLDGHIATTRRRPLDARSGGSSGAGNGLGQGDRRAILRWEREQQRLSVAGYTRFREDGLPVADRGQRLAEVPVPLDLGALCGVCRAATRGACEQDQEPPRSAHREPTPSRPVSDGFAQGMAESSRRGCARFWGTFVKAALHGAGFAPGHRY